MLAAMVADPAPCPISCVRSKIILYYNIRRRSLHRLAYGLSRELWLVQVGIFLNSLGCGAVLPFEVIYLHEHRGLPLGLAGLVVGTLTGLAVVAAPLSGPLIDRFGALSGARKAGARAVS